MSKTPKNKQGFYTAPQPQPADPDAARQEAFEAMDRMRDMLISRFSSGVSPASLALAYMDWALHLQSAPGKQLEMIQKAFRKSNRLSAYLLSTMGQEEADCCIEPLPGDNRFRDPAWRKQPFGVWSQSFLLTQQWWHNLTHDVPGVSPHHEEVVSFVARQLLDVFSPSNNPFTNPEVLERTRETGGQNFVAGFNNWREDVRRQIQGKPPVGTEDFIPGEDVAVTPGRVVFRNHLIELIQYAPATKEVHAEPVLIVPAWIMKYYILDLSPQNSMVKYLTEQGFTVFAISWRNPSADDRDLSLNDYRRMGVMDALEAINAVCPDRKVHATGYCLGGTLLSIAASAMARDGDDRLASVSLLAAQTDFSEPGELALFIDHSQMHFLESIMWNRGFLSADEMAGAFQLLRSNDLLWSRMVKEYMMGERPPMFDLMAWNADTTRMPYRMHSEYLKKLYINNDLANGRFMVDGRPVTLQGLRVPVFAVGTEHDHVAPWRSVYKIHQLADTDVTFALANGGHNAGIVSEPGHNGRHYRIAHHRHRDQILSPDQWLEASTEKTGSWWTGWSAWLAKHSSAGLVRPPRTGAARKGYPALEEAPGTYVFQR
ncbi:PHA/PHB synthase family protein [Hyphomonas sp.]|uniref:PHA/PHB synthase family protein n=1 Tax=Hyphomonas sp. TaxID=87 RepID=UPI003528D0EA